MSQARVPAKAGALLAVDSAVHPSGVGKMSTSVTAGETKRLLAALRARVVGRRQEGHPADENNLNAPIKSLTVKAVQAQSIPGLKDRTLHHSGL